MLEQYLFGLVDQILVQLKKALPIGYRLVGQAQPNHSNQCLSDGLMIFIPGTEMFGKRSYASLNAFDGRLNTILPDTDKG